MLQAYISNRAMRVIPILMLTANLLAACGVVDRAAPRSAAAPTPAPPAATPAPGDRLYIHDGGQGGAERLALIDSISGARQRDLPPGVVSPDWRTLYVAEQQNGNTMLRALDLASGQTARETQIEGAYSMPMITPDSVLGGLSPNGRWLALTARSDKQTAFVVLDTSFQQPARQVALEGYFLFDGLNNGGTSLFLTESLGDDPAAKYQVRRYDLMHGALDPNVIVDKLEGTRIMSGVRQTAVASKDGSWLYSLYLNPDHGPFIHALPVNEAEQVGLAFCIDLPAEGKDDPAKQSRWALLMSADMRTLFAVNGALGLVVEYTLLDNFPQQQRVKSLFDAQQAASALAAPTDASASSIAALAPDGKTMYALGQRGVLVIDRQSLTLRGRFLPDWALDGIAVAPDSGRLYVASAAQGKIVRLDQAAGTIAAEVPAAGQPSGLVRVAGKSEN